MDLIQSVDPKLWGPPAWIYLDAVVTSYPSITENDEMNPIVAEEWVNRMYMFWKHLYLPCVVCMKHYEQFLVDYPIEDALCDAQSYREWFNKLKSAVRSTSTTSDTAFLEVQPMPVQGNVIQQNPVHYPVHNSVIHNPVIHNPIHNNTTTIHRPVHHPIQRRPVLHPTQNNQPVRAKVNRPCPCASRHTMTSMIQAGSANMISRKR